MLSNKTVLITGGTGSFGKKCTKLILRNYKPSKLIIYSRDELKQFEMHQQFPEDKYPCMRYFIGDIRDKERLTRAFQGVDYVIHAAALKQVPACEYNPFEAIKTNIQGAQNIIDVSINSKVKKVISLSTDKAVNPANLYGATKLCADKLFTQGNAYSPNGGTVFSCVRYGNVIGSRGSVVAVFLKQRRMGKLTITDQRMTRFWITLDQAVELVFKAFRYMQGGEIFVPKIPSMKIVDLAEVLAPGCQIEITGIRPGEKLHEILISEEEGRTTYSFKDIYVILPQFSWWKLKEGKDYSELPEGFTYKSDYNKQWLSKREMKEIIQNDSLKYKKESLDIFEAIHDNSNDLLLKVLNSEGQIA